MTRSVSHLSSLLQIVLKDCKIDFARLLFSLVLASFSIVISSRLNSGQDVFSFVLLGRFVEHIEDIMWSTLYHIDQISTI